MNQLRQAIARETMAASRRRVSAIAGGLIVIGLTCLAVGCSSNESQTPAPAPSTTPTTTPSTTAPPPSLPSTQPTEKGLDPSGGNPFTPTVSAPPVPQQPPGFHPHYG